MSITNWTSRIWVVVSPTLLFAPLLSGALAAATLDTLARRSSDTGSITTMFPGFV